MGLAEPEEVEARRDLAARREVHAVRARTERADLAMDPAPSGHIDPRLTRAMMSHRTNVFPRPPLPANVVSLDSGIRPGHSHSTARGVTSLAQ